LPGLTVEIGHQPLFKEAVLLQLDTVTTILLTVANALVMLLMLVHTYATRKTYPGFLFWIASMACWFSGGVLSYLLRGRIDPFWVIVAGNGLLLSMPVLFNEGVNRFYGLPARWWRFPLNLALLFIAVAALHYATFINDSLAWRGIIISLGYGLFFLRTAAEPLLFAPPARHHSIQWLLSLCMLPLSFFHFMRLPYFVANPGLRNFAELAARDQYLLTAIILANSIIILVTYSCLSLTSERVESELHKSQQQARIIAEKQRELFAMVTHEFKTPLAVIDRSAQMISFRAINPDEALTRRLGVIRANATHLIGLLDNCMNDAVLAQGMLQLNSTDIQLPDLLQEIREQCAEARPDREIRLLMPERVPNLNGDKRLLALLFLNLLDNALKFSDETKPVLLELRQAPGELLVTVSDSGIGIPPEELDQLGKQTCRASNVAQIPGSGIGLHTARLIAQLHNGSLTIRSSLAEGTSITVSLPAAIANRKA
jgi:signal transduction histidine kinase